MISDLLSRAINGIKEVIEVSKTFNTVADEPDIKEHDEDDDGYDRTRFDDTTASDNTHSGASYIQSEMERRLSQEYVLYSRALSKNFFKDPKAVVKETFSITCNTFATQDLMLSQSEAEHSAYFIWISENAVLVNKELWNRDILPLLKYAINLKPERLEPKSSTNGPTSIIGRKEIQKTAITETTQQRKVKFTDIHSEDHVETVPLDEVVLNVNTEEFAEEPNASVQAVDEDHDDAGEESSLFFNEDGGLDAVGTFGADNLPTHHFVDMDSSFFTYIPKQDAIAREDLRIIYKNSKSPKNLNDYYLLVKRNSLAYQEITSHYSRAACGFTSLPNESYAPMDRKFQGIASGVFYAYVKSLVEICNLDDSALNATKYAFTVEGSSSDDPSVEYEVMEGHVAWIIFEKRFSGKNTTLITPNNNNIL